MSVPADEMRRRVPVARPSAQQLLGHQPGAAFSSQAAGQHVPVTPSAAAGSTPPLARPGAPVLGEAGMRARVAAAPGGVTSPGAARVPPGVTGAFGPTPVVNPSVGAIPPNAAASMGAPPPAPPTGSTAERVGRSAGQAYRATSNAVGATARMGAAPVQTTPGRVLPRTAPGQMGGAGAALGLTGIFSGLQAMGTPTENYEQRTGIQGGTLPRDLAVRSLGALSDLGANVVDPFIGAGNMAGRAVEAVFPNAPDALTRQMPTLRSRFADVQAGDQQFQPPSAATLAASALSAPANASPAPAGPRADFSGVSATVDSTAAAPGQPRTGLKPGDPNSFTFSDGRTVDANTYQSPNPLGQMDSPAATQLAAPVRGGAGGSSGGPTTAHIGAGGGTIEKIDRAIADIGPLDRRGRRSAVADLLGLRQRIEGGDADRTSAEQRSAAELGQRSAAAELAAEVDREQIAASGANARRQNTQTITDASGTTYAIGENNTLTPLTTPDGQPLQAATKTDTSLQDLAAKLLQGDPELQMGGDPNAAAQRAAQGAMALQALMSGGGQKAQPGAPAPGAVVDGYRFKGGDPAQPTSWERAQ